MKIAVISDTHLREPDHRLTEVFNTYLIKADLLIHCGDHASMSVWNFFCQHPNFYAVLGNCDGFDLADHIKPFETINFNGLTIGATHGWGARSEVVHNASNYFGVDYDLVCYGHTHIQDWSIKNGVQVLNPGSFTRPRDSKPASIAIVDVDEEQNMNCKFIAV